MSIDTFRDSLPDSTKDIRLNLSSVLSQPELTPVQAWGTALACALNTRCSELISEVRTEASQVLSEAEVNAATSAASLMAMTNVYYRFSYLSGDPEFATMPARLRMNVLRGHGIDSGTFELWCLAVSAVNGCQKCVESHWRQLQEHGVTRDVVLAAIRIASVIEGAAVSASAR